MEPAGHVETLIFGAGGLVGQSVARALDQRRLTWAGTYHQRPQPGLAAADITKPGDVARVMETCRPRVVVHCANLAGGVDFCEAHPDLARAFHVEATKTIAGWCEQTGAALLLLSTDYVFDGTRAPYAEEDPTTPVNVYGRAKLEAEAWIRGRPLRSIIVRTTNVFGWDPATPTPNYLMSLYRALSAGRRFAAPSFLWGNPTYAGDLAEAILELVLAGASGVYHVVGPSLVNRFDWALEACRALGLDASLVEELTTPSPTMAPRPLRSWLRTDKFRSVCHTALRDMRSGLEAMRADLLCQAVRA